MSETTFRKSETIAALAEALSKAQGEIKAAEMNATNPFLKNRYADLGAITEVVKAPLAKHGLSYVQPMFGDDHHLGVETVLMHSSGEWISSAVSLPVSEDKGRSMAQNAGAIVTYLRRYALSAMLGIVADEDTDGNEKKDGHKQETKAPAKAPAEPFEPKMSLETAMAVTNRDGVQYGALPDDKLGYMHKALIKAIKENSLTPEDKEQHEYKRDAIDVILHARSKAGAQS